MRVTETCGPELQEGIGDDAQGDDVFLFVVVPTTRRDEEKVTLLAQWRIIRIGGDELPGTAAGAVRDGHADGTGFRERDQVVAHGVWFRLD